MKPTENKYVSFIRSRDTWTVTLIAVVIVLGGILGMGVDMEDGFSWQKIGNLHRDHPFIVILEGIPLYMYIIMRIYGLRMQSAIEKSEEQLKATKDLIGKNAEFARSVSEGENPEPFDGMLDSELGKSLKLIHLNIKSNRRKEQEITWITEGKDMISRVLRVHNEIDELSYQILKSLSRYIDAIQGAAYIYDEDSELIKNVAVLAYNRRKYVDQVFRIGEGLVGQCAYEMDFIHRTEIPDDYVSITSGILGDQKPKSIVIVPLITNEKLQGILEFAFLQERIPKLTIQFLLELGEIIARTLFNLQINEKTRSLLNESRQMTEELKKSEKELQENAEEMKVTQDKLQETNIQLEKKIEEEKLAQDRLHWLLANASEIIAIYDKDIRLTYISPSVTPILGYGVDEMMNGKDFERIDQQGGKDITRAFDRLKEYPSESMSLEYTFSRKDGSRIFLQSTIRNLLNDPSIEGFLFNTRDITETKMIEKEQRMKSRMQSLSENSLDLIIRISATGVIYYTNPVVEDYSGISPSSILNKPLGDVPFNKALKEILQEAMHKVVNRPVKFNMEESLPVQMGDKQGERILSFNVIPELQENELETVLIVGHDITEAKRIEKEIQISNRKVQDSINYAERIQSSILPSTESIRSVFRNSFVYYRPKDVISGDFPWFRETDDAWYIAAIDCTGHGVPGALLSFIGFFLLNNITAVNPDLEAGGVCDELNREVRRTLKQDRKNPETRDGMDIALCKISKNMDSLEYVGAHRPLYRLREGEISVYKGDRKAIGGMVHPKKKESDFTTHRLDIRKGDKIFMFSDGLTDQLGGPKGSKYSPARVRSAILENPGFTIAQFHEHFKKDFEQWTGNEKQIDDVLMIGIGF